MRPVRIVVAEPGRAQRRLPTVGALQRLGGGVRIEIVNDARACLELASGADLVIVDRELGDQGREILSGLRGVGPPAVVVTREATADAALDTFRAGAADCVTASADFDEVLPAVALEQIRAFRAASARRAVRERIESLERLHAAIVDHFPAAVAVLDADDRLVAVNPAFARAFPARAEPFEGRPLEDVLPADLLASGGLAELVARARARGGDPPRIARTQAGGAARAFDARAERLDAQGRTVLVLAEVTERERLKQLQQQVLQTEKMASIGQLAAGVAHEINNPMGFIHANLAQMGEYLGDVHRLHLAGCALAERAAAEGTPALRGAGERLLGLARELDADRVFADFAQAIRESQEGSERIRHIVQDLRAFSHRDDGQLVCADLNRCLDSTAHIVWTMMKHSVVLRKEYAPLPPLPCHPLQLEQVFMNLLVNAYQAIEERVRRDGGSGEIVLRTAAAADGVLVSVSDDGGGISVEPVERIFEPFFTTKEVGVGMGLGLATCFDIVRRHGGALRARNRAGGGATFEVFLPLAGPPDAEPGA
ncbi:MAG TPA: ATP-binding protein [Myxococcota bacterium]|nr:ATP-binding protein [Myxococcota bacterium]